MCYTLLAQFSQCRDADASYVGVVCVSYFPLPRCTAGNRQHHGLRWTIRLKTEGALEDGVGGWRLGVAS